MIKIEVIGNLFQFHKGAIRTYADLFVKLRKQNFNSIKVRLERSLGYTTTAVLLYFNSIKVRLEHASASSLASSIVYFNSIKVRLELNFGCIEFRLRLFQFHKGAIRTTDSNPYFFTFIDFNSIKVRLELVLSLLMLRLIMYFNSIKVRLELAGHALAVKIWKFQFHKGAIRTTERRRS